MRAYDDHNHICTNNSIILLDNIKNAHLLFKCVAYAAANTATYTG
jgi:hypothetical protein